MAVGDIALVGVRWASAAIVITLAAILGTMLGAEVWPGDENTQLQAAMDACVEQAGADGYQVIEINSLGVELVQRASFTAYRVVSPYWTCLAYPVPTEPFEAVVYPP